MSLRQFLIDFRHEHDRQRADDRNAPKVSDPAPDFELAGISGRHTVCLSDLYHQRPVALIFGSFT